MKKRVYFGSFDGPWWPDPRDIEEYFLAPPGREWSYKGGNDTWGLEAEGLYDTEGLTPETGRVDVTLYMCGHPDHGVYLVYHKWDGRTHQKDEYSSKGDLRRLHEWAYSRQGDPLPIGLFVPFPKAWFAVKEFIETDGKLPTSIEWVADKDIPASAFPR
ncbi:Imm1 family immunity protein [Rhodoplanes sp. TEM]|uniref:Imm1 family immunity protein n=1 Tax=Rhodoplanes tepidamans TaxID=200616 RepID=A0ABT5J7N9_RHOTP|nr:MULTISPECIES: Imm1 family immunity protein [Rhodoplanes]MDC7785671.1 Imm1 family immunity protein [Rhodoplanes tepidamans]MDC7983312.1 Imm1 family immunity protein [Rhodoplanes sp. TEM]MDQ0354762.1 hypothetical protein [Rhodoplanes tepidamans]